jgi:hypothetical protein
MNGYTKLFSSIVTSTIWQAPSPTRILWITLLAAADKNGEVAGSVPGLAHLASISVAEAEAGFAELSAPDPYSRTPDNEGRRIAKIDGGWQILNHAKYRAKLSADDRREYLAKKQREHRAKQAMSTPCQQPSTNVNSVNTMQSAESREQNAEKYIPPPSASVVKKDPLQIRVESLFRRRLSTPWTKAELNAWKTARSAVADTTPENWAILEKFYGLPKDDPRGAYRRTSMAALLNDWNSEPGKAERNLNQTNFTNANHRPNPRSISATDAAIADYEAAGGAAKLGL